MRRTASPSRVGSVGSRGLGFYLKVNIAVGTGTRAGPIIKNVAVPALKHSPIFGQDASSQTVLRAKSRKAQY